MCGSGGRRTRKAAYWRLLPILILFDHEDSPDNSVVLTGGCASVVRLNDLAHVLGKGQLRSLVAVSTPASSFPGIPLWPRPPGPLLTLASCKKHGCRKTVKRLC